jgi:hypothetical protein
MALLPLWWSFMPPDTRTVSDYLGFHQPRRRSSRYPHVFTGAPIGLEFVFHPITGWQRALLAQKVNWKCSTMQWYLTSFIRIHITIEFFTGKGRERHTCTSLNRTQIFFTKDIRRLFTMNVKTMTHIPIYIYLSLSIPVAPTFQLRAFVQSFVSLQLLNPKRVGRTPWTADESVVRTLPTHIINADGHQWLVWDSNPRSLCSSERRQFMPYTERPLWSAHIPPVLKKAVTNKTGTILRASNNSSKGWTLHEKCQPSQWQSVSRFDFTVRLHVSHPTPLPPKCRSFPPGYFLFTSSFTILSYLSLSSMMWFHDNAC